MLASPIPAYSSFIDVTSSPVACAYGALSYAPGAIEEVNVRQKADGHKGG